MFEKNPVIFCCTCSIKRSENALLLLGQTEAEQELEDKQTIFVTCEFCHKNYVFDRIDIAVLFKNNNQPPASTQVH